MNTEERGRCTDANARRICINSKAKQFGRGQYRCEASGKFRIWSGGGRSGFIPRSHRERLDRALLQPGEVSGQVRFSEIADALTVDNLGAVYAPQLISIVEINRGYPAIADK